MPRDRKLAILARLAPDTGTEMGTKRLCEVCAEATDMSGAGIMLMSGDTPRGSICTTGAVSALIEDLQYELGEGPCVDAYSQNRPVLEPDLAAPATARWPAFTGPALTAGADAIFGFPLRVGAIRLGAMNLFRDRAGALDDEQHANALVMADVAADAVLLLQAGAPNGEIAKELGAGADRHRLPRIEHRPMTSSDSPPQAHDTIGPTGRLATAEADLIGGLPRSTRLAQALVELADTLVADFDVVELLSRLTDRCIDVLDVSAGGIMLAGPGHGLQVMASSSEAMRLLELFEIQSEEGPCLDCFATGLPVVNQDLDHAGERWPRFASKARDAGFASVHALPMRLRGTVIGSLNLFHTSPSHLRQADVDAGQALADIATIAILQHRAALEAQVLNDQLNNALNTRIVIEQAKGIVAERQSVDLDASFRVLRNHARNHNLRLASVAEAIVAGTLGHATLDPLPTESTADRRPRESV